MNIKHHLPSYFHWPYVFSSNAKLREPTPPLFVEQLNFAEVAAGEVHQLRNDHNSERPAKDTHLPGEDHSRKKLWDDLPSSELT